MGGDEGAFQQIHQRLDAGLKRQFLERAGGRADLADDLSQRTWIAVWRAFQGGKYHPERAAISTFVYAVGVKIWLQHLRANRRPIGQLPATLADAAGEDADPSLVLKLAELLDSLREGLKPGNAGPLSEEERWIVQEAARGESDRTLAKRLGVAPSTLNVRKRGALDKLRRFLSSRGHRAETGERDDGGDE
jgi:RNA polymerase sigma factor (sigma-70 family)